jgi:hypothetical protein
MTPENKTKSDTKRKKREDFAWKKKRAYQPKKPDKPPKIKPAQTEKPPKELVPDD